MKHEYHEGPKAGEDFKKLAGAVFQTPKTDIPKEQPEAMPVRNSSCGAAKARQKKTK